MSELRWILLIAGIALIVGLYLLRRRATARRTPVDVERPARVDPPRPASPVETSRLEPRIVARRRRDSQFTMDDGPDDDLVAEPAAPAPLSARRDAGLGARPEPPMGPETRYDRSRDCAPSRSSAIRRCARHGTPRDRAEHRDQAAHVRSRARDGSAIAAEDRRDARHRGASERVSTARCCAKSLTAARLHARPLRHLPSPGLRRTPDHQPGEPARARHLRSGEHGHCGVSGDRDVHGLPGPLPAARAFDELLDTARALAHRLGGQLQDERGAPLQRSGYSSCARKCVAFERTARRRRRRLTRRRWQHARPPGASTSCAPRSSTTTTATTCSTIRRSRTRHTTG